MDTLFSLFGVGFAIIVAMIGLALILGRILRDSNPSDPDEEARWLAQREREQRIQAWRDAEAKRRHR